MEQKTRWTMWYDPEESGDNSLTEQTSGQVIIRNLDRENVPGIKQAQTDMEERDQEESGIKGDDQTKSPPNRQTQSPFVPSGSAAVDWINCEPKIFRKTLLTVGGNVNGCSHCGEVWREGPQKTKNRGALWASNPTPGYVSEENNSTNLKRHAPQCSLQLYLQ